MTADEAWAAVEPRVNALKAQGDGIQEFDVPVSREELDALQAATPPNEQMIRSADGAVRLGVFGLTFVVTE